MTKERDPKTAHLLFTDYWKHQAAKRQAALVPRPVVRRFQTEGFDEAESLYWNRCCRCTRVLEIGAGDKKLKAKFLSHGYEGQYHTLDVSTEFSHDYEAVEDVTGHYDAVLLLEVIEHIPLEEFSRLMQRVQDLLTSDGTVIVSTPNPACVRPMWAGDMTHIQQYPLDDLLAFFIVRQFRCESYRVLYAEARLSLLEWIRLILKKLIAIQILGADYADGLIVIAKAREP